MNGPSGEPSSALPRLPEVEQLEARVQSRLLGRVRDLRLLWRGGGLVLQGHAPTYYAKQLAQHAVLEATALPLLANDIQVRGAVG
jgi:hypothetical protein